MKRLTRVLMVFVLTLTLLCSFVVMPYAEEITDSGADTETIVDTTGDTAADTDPDAATDANAESDVDSGAATGTDAEPDINSDTGTETVIDPDAATNADAAAGADADTDKVDDAETEEDATPTVDPATEERLLAEVGKHGIPVVYVNVDESETTIDQMNEDEKHDTKCTGKVDIMVPEDCTDAFGQASYASVEGLELDYIRGRGNSTWAEDKKPYKIKFKNKQSFFGMGSDKEWALMANANDPTMFKNIITAWLGNQMGFAYSPNGVPVELVMSGEKYGTHYLGCYFLSELVNRGDERVNIEKLGKKVVKTEEEAADGEANISGGYLVSIFCEAQDWDEPANNIFKTDSGLGFLMQDPEYESEELTEGQTAQLKYIREYMQKLEDLITAKEIDHDAVAELMDMQSAADYWLIQEFCKNADAFQTHSTYFNKARGGKLFWGPLWDFDLAYEVEGEIDPVSEINYTEMPWIDHLRAKDPAFRALVLDRWELLKQNLNKSIEKDGIIDQYEAALTSAWNANHELWPYLDEMDGEISYHERVNSLREFIQKRLDVVDSVIEKQLDKVFVNVHFVADGKEIAMLDDVRLNCKIENIPKEPFKKGYVFENWYEKESGKLLDDVAILSDLTFIAKYVPESEAIAPKDLFLWPYEEWAAIQDYSFGMPYMYISPFDATDNRITFKSTDESIATIENNEILLHSTGDVVFKASTYNGITKNYTLHVYDNTKTTVQPVTGVKARSSSITMAKGKEVQILLDLYPKGVPLDYQYIGFHSSDESVAEVDFMGVVTSKKAGTATIKYTAFDSDDNALASGTVKVTVSKSKNPLKVKGKKVIVKYKKLKKKAQTVKRTKAMSVSKAQGKVTYKLVSVNKARSKGSYKKYFKVNKKTGKITVRKRLRKGSYYLKIKVTAAGNSQYKAASKTRTVKIRVK